MQRISMIDNTSSETIALPSAKGEEAANQTKHLLESLRPVPLSDVVLKQCGFVYQDYFKFWQLITGAEENRSEMDIDRDYNILDFMRKPIVKKVLTLHQLQNIYYMLNGKELAYQVN